jgi:hypothetical protein
MYCSPECRPSGVARSGRLTVEVDHESQEDDCRPVGRVWFVKICRGRRQVVVATELGRPSADHLAAQIEDLIRPRRRADGGAME